MKREPPAPADDADLLDRLAVAPRMKTEWLAGLSGGAQPPGWIDTAAALPGVRLLGEWLELDPQPAAARLRSLEDRDLRRYCDLHREAVDYLGRCLRAGQSDAEAPFLAAFERLANRLQLDDPAGFVRLVDSASGPLPISSAGSRKLEYFQALALVKSERYPEAIAVFDRLLSRPDLEAETRSRALNSRANCYFFTGRFEPAVRDYRLSLEMWRLAGNPLRQGIALLNLGIIAYDLQDYVQAQASLQEAVEMFTAAGSDQQLASARNELGLVYRDLGRWEAARENLQAAADQRRKDGAVDSLGAALNNLGEVLLLQGRFDEAEAQLREALQAMSTRLWAIEAHLNLGLIQQASGRLEQAQAEYTRALQLSQAIGRGDNLALIHYRLGDVLRRKNETGRALEHHRLSAESVESAWKSMHDEGLKISLIGRWQQTFEALALLCLEAGLPQEAFHWAERSRARAFAETLFARRSADAPQAETPAAALTEAAEPVVGLPELQACLPADTAVLCFFTTGVLDRESPMLRALPAQGPVPEHLLVPGRTLLFTITARSFSARICPIDPNLLSYRSRGGEDGSRFTAPAVLERLQAALLPKELPDAPGFPAGLREVVVIPHGPLHRLPFSAFPALRQGPAIVYAPSAGMLQRSLCARPEAPESRRLKPCLAVGFDGAAEEQRLRHPEMEARWIAEIEGGEAWAGPEPKADRLKRSASEYRRIHFSCHGWFDELAPMNSHLETAIDERITAREVLESWKLQADLVVLSACRTGVSRILRSDEPMGLVRAFLTAGARCVLGSLWPVDDLPTFLLMRFFYAELERLGEHPAQALFNAQRRLAALSELEAAAWMPASPSRAAPAVEAAAHIKDADGERPSAHRPFADPFYWAGFILVGS